MVMFSYIDKLAKHRVKWFTDNQAVAKIITSGTMKEELQKIAVDILQPLCQKKTSPLRWSGFQEQRMKGQIISVEL